MPQGLFDVLAGNRISCKSESKFASTVVYTCDSDMYMAWTPDRPRYEHGPEVTEASQGTAAKTHRGPCAVRRARTQPSQLSGICRASSLSDAIHSCLVKIYTYQDRDGFLEPCTGSYVRIQRVLAEMARSDYENLIDNSNR